MENTENLKFKSLVEMTVYFSQRKYEKFGVCSEVMTGEEIAFYYIENANEWDFCLMNENKEE